MKKDPSHNWHVSPAEAREIQKGLQEQVRVEPLKKEVTTIAGADISTEWHGSTAYAGFVVLSYPDLTPVNHALAQYELNFPYIPGLLSFREIPALLEAWEKLATKPDLVMIDGHGIAHPRRLGIATHFGLVADVPTIGVAKHVLTGNFTEPNQAAGSHSHLKDPKTGEVIGAVVRTKVNTKPVFVSPGYRTSLEDAIRFTLAATRDYKLPETTRQAHNLVNAFRRGEL
jgi:deoxyribonuclease V